MLRTPRILNFYTIPVIRGAVLLALAGLSLFAEPPGGAIQGRAVDSSGAVLQELPVSVHGPNRFTATTVTSGEGKFIFNALSPGSYVVSVEQPGFAPFESETLNVISGQATRLEIELRLQVKTEELKVTDQSPSPVNTDAAANAGAIVLSGADLDALPDDPDDLAADLRAMSGTLGGPGGSQIYIDGFSGGRIPPKDSIREIRINQNPFSAEFDRVGLGRTEIFTKPGSDRYRGSVSFKASDAVLNSRNPYSPVKPPYQARQFDGDIGGPLGRRASFFFDFERRDADDNSLLNATVLDPSLQIVPLTKFTVSPQHYWALATRVDYQISPNHTLTGRLSWTQNHQTNAGLSAFLLPSLAYRGDTGEKTVQLTETAVLAPNAVNEARFQFSQAGDQRSSLSRAPTINVLDAFLGGGSTYGDSSSTRSGFELQNYTSVTEGAHLFKFGGRLREVQLDDRSLRNFNGRYIFSGGVGPQLDANNQAVLGASGTPLLVPISSIESYRRTLLFQAQGLPADQIRALGGGPSQFSLTAGNPLASVEQKYFNLFAQDEWRVRPSLTVSLGIRWEHQGRVNDWRDLAPRFGFAWSPDSHRATQGKTVIRGGSGLFYQPFSEDLTLNIVRFDGANQQQVLVRNPNFFPSVPPIASLNGQQNSLVYQASPALKAPYLLQSAIALERQLPYRLVLSASYVNTHGERMFLSRNVSAPAGITYQYESAGKLNSNQIITNLSRRMTGRFSIFSYYAYNRSRSNTDGPSWFPSNQAGLAGEYGRSSSDIRHQVVAGGLIRAPWGLNVSPFFTARSGAPFDITTGLDSNKDSLYNDRPALVKPGTPGAVQTRYGAFLLVPGALPVIPRNFGQGPGFSALNLRLSRTFGFGGRTEAKSKTGKGGGSSVSMTGFDEGALRGILRDASSGRRFNLTVSVVVRNVLNTANPGVPVGNLSSPLFGQSNWLASSSGPDVAASGDNRRLWLQIRLNF